MGIPAFDPSRRRFLRGSAVQDIPVKRPPWGVAEENFVERCVRCDDCIEVCPEHILVRGSGGYPEVDFSRGGCSLCGDCAAACSEDAFYPLQRDQRLAWMHRARIETGCLSMKGIVCRACGDACEPAAIRFRLQTGGRSVPLVDLDECTGCGSCRYSCPIDAVSLTIPEEGQTPCPA